VAKDGADNENEPAEDEAPEAKSKKKLIISVVLVLLLAAVAAKMFIRKPKPLSAAETAAKQKTEEIALHDKCAAANGMKLLAKTTPTTVAADESKVLSPNDNSVTVNLADGAYLKVGIALQLDASLDPKVAKDDGLGDRATDITLKELARHRMSGLAPPAARNRVQQQLSFDVCKAYDGQITNVYFTEFVMQAS
jgi:flagellar FliL protein